MTNSKSHIIKYVDGVPAAGVLIRILISTSGVVGYIMFNDYFFNQDNLWMYVPINLLYVGLWICWPIFDLLSWNKIECDTHNQKFTYKSILKGTVVLPFDANE